MTDRVSVHIATFNRPQELAVCLASLYAQSFKDWDLVVVDDSNPGMLSYKPIADLVARFRQEGHAVIYHHPDARNGVASARNECVKKDWTKNEWCLRVDDDSYMERDYLDKLMYAVNETKDDEKPTGAIGGVVPNFSGATPKIEVPIRLFNEIRFKPDEGRVEFEDDGGLEYYPVGGFDMVGGVERWDLIQSDHLRSSFLFRRSAWEKTKGFPEWTGSVGWREETIFCMELKWLGYQLLTDPGAKCYHAVAPNGGVRMEPSAASKQRALIEESVQAWALWKFEAMGRKY